MPFIILTKVKRTNRSEIYKRVWIATLVCIYSELKKIGNLINVELCRLTALFSYKNGV